jgi:TonB-dependent SusC/RagA subfamily outer membrane receptor
VITEFRFYGTPHLKICHPELAEGLKTKLMRIISTLCLLLLSSVCFSQLYEMIRASEYNPKKSSEYKDDVYICGMRGRLLTVTAISNIQDTIVKNDSLKTILSCRIPSINILPTPKNIPDTPVKIKLRCWRTLTDDDNPLIVIDGVPIMEGNGISSINPNEIVSINILKSPECTILYGYRASKGVILVTTKNTNQRKFIIKDFLDGNRIPGATVSFISADKKDTIMMAANDSGVVVTDKLKSSGNYQISVSAVGYKSLSQAWKNNYGSKEQEILLEKGIKICDEVILGGGYVIRCHRNYQCIKVSNCFRNTITADTTYSIYSRPVESQLATKSIFPNPVQKGRSITIETAGQSDNQLQIRIISLDGKLLLSRSQKAFKDLNRFTINTDPRWAAGIYFVQLYANGKLLASDKLVIQ